jgi:hypothetical protein
VQQVQRALRHLVYLPATAYKDPIRIVAWEAYMAQRWKRIGILTGAIFAINLVGRLVSAFALDADSSKQKWVPIIGLSVIAALYAVLTFYWGRVRPLGEVAGDLLGAGVASCVLIVVVGPLLFGKSPFADGAGDFFASIWQYAGILVGAALLGTAVLVVLGMDLRSKQLKAYAGRAKAKPKRV